MIVDLAIECKQCCIFSIRHNGYCLFPPLFTFEKYLFRYQQHGKLPAYKCAQLHYGCPCQNQPFLPQIVQKFEAVTALQLNKQDSPISTACELLSRAAPCIPAPVKGRKPWLCSISVFSLCSSRWLLQSLYPTDFEASFKRHVRTKRVYNMLLLAYLDKKQWHLPGHFMVTLEYYELIIQISGPEQMNPSFPPPSSKSLARTQCEEHYEV